MLSECNFLVNTNARKCVPHSATERYPSQRCLSILILCQDAEAPIAFWGAPGVLHASVCHTERVCVCVCV